MAINHSPSIVTNGLVFAYDMANTQKSWKGAPTTNYVTNALAMTGWSNYSNGTPVAITTSLGTPGYGFYNAGSWNGINRSVTIPSTGTYTFSAWVRYIGGSTNNNGGGVYISGWGGGDTASVTNRTLPGQWQRLSVTLNCTNTTFTFYLISWGGTSGADNSSWEMTMPQAEAGSYATPFVNGTRSNTQAIYDLTGNNTITAQSLTYASDGTFSWAAGTDARLQSPSSSNFAFGTSDFTVECWIKPVNFNSYTHMVALPDQSTFALKANVSDGAIYFYSSAFTTYGSTTGWTLTANIWNHVIMTRSSGVAYCYLNGSLIGSKSAFTNSFTSQVLNIGNGYTNEYTAKGISSVKIYNRALSAAEVKQNFNALRGRYGL